MHIIIPMAGKGERFRAAGYTEPKPLITVEGKPIIRHVVEMFSPKEDLFTFVCNDDDYEKFGLEAFLGKVATRAKVIPIKYEKFGPVWGVLQALEKEDFIDDGEQTIVNYCDFSAWWDYRDFQKAVSNPEWDGCITAYRGFHPHSLGTTMYGYLRCGDGGRLLEIREKECFTANRMGEFASAGTYYFKRGGYVRKYFQEQWDRKIQKNGEYYVSLCYNLMARDGLGVYPYELERFLQWGTPEDLSEYLYWSEVFLSKGGHDFENRGSQDPRIFGYWKSFFSKKFRLDY
jgi:NDP-sugar pyrophosphorylase family protein